MPAPTTVSPADQLALLELQQTDSALDQARARLQALRQDADYQSLRAEAARLQTETDAAQATLDAARTAQEEADRKVTSSREHLDRNRTRMETGSASAKDLQGMQHEIETLQRLIAEQEDAELETMDAVEQAEAAYATARQAQDAADAAVTSRAEAVKTEAGQVQARGKELTAQREQQAGALAQELVEYYQSLRARTGGVAVARLVGSRSEASGMNLSPKELDQIQQTPADQLAFCPETGAILVRGTD